MRKVILIGLVAGLLVAPPCSTKAELLKIAAGALVNTVPVQTSPPPFATYSQWGGISLSVLFKSVTFDATVRVADFKTMRIVEHPNLYIVSKIRIAQLGPVAMQASVGLSTNPYYKWNAFSVGLGATVASPIPFTEIRSRIFIATTTGAPGGFSAGTGLCVDVGVFVSIPFF